MYLARDHPKADRSSITWTNRGVRLSARWQRCPGSSASTFPFRIPEGIRSGERFRFCTLQSLPFGHGIHALQGVATCCQRKVVFGPIALPKLREVVRRHRVQGHPLADQNGRLPPSGIVRR